MTFIFYFFNKIHIWLFIIFLFEEKILFILNFLFSNQKIVSSKTKKKRKKMKKKMKLNIIPL